MAELFIKTDVFRALVRFLPGKRFQIQAEREPAHHSGASHETERQIQSSFNAGGRKRSPFRVRPTGLIRGVLMQSLRMLLPDGILSVRITISGEGAAGKEF